MSLPAFNPRDAFAPLPSSKGAFLDRVAEYFQAHPEEWIDATVLQNIGGRFAWRTRVSECRTQLGMEIENRQRRTQRRTISEYRFVPKGQAFRLIPDDAEIPGEGG